MQRLQPPANRAQLIPLLLLLCAALPLQSLLPTRKVMFFASFTTQQALARERADAECALRFALHDMLPHGHDDNSGHARTRAARL